MKIYCEGCRFYYFGGEFVCTHPKAKKRTVAGSDGPIHSVKNKVFGSAWDTNLKNNCKLRVQKPWWMFWRG